MSRQFTTCLLALLFCAGVSRAEAPARQKLRWMGHWKTHRFAYNLYLSEHLAHPETPVKPGDELSALESGMAQILEETSLTEEQADCTQTIKDSARGLMKIINDILDLSRIEMGTITLQNEPVFIRSMLTELDRLFTPDIS